MKFAAAIVASVCLATAFAHEVWWSSQMLILVLNNIRNKYIINLLFHQADFLRKSENGQSELFFSHKFKNYAFI